MHRRDDRLDRRKHSCPRSNSEHTQPDKPALPACGRTIADALGPQRAPTPRDQLRPYGSTRTPTFGPESAPTGGGGLALSRCPMLQLEASTSIQNVIDTSRSPTVISADVLKHFDPRFVRDDFVDIIRNNCWPERMHSHRTYLSSPERRLSAGNRPKPWLPSTSNVRICGLLVALRAAAMTHAQRGSNQSN
jgi:hypothetical protein